ncbi:MAG: hypothetical protein ACYCO3_10400 [Mycobacteriales bacterium]
MIKTRVIGLTTVLGTLLFAAGCANSRPQTPLPLPRSLAPQAVLGGSLHLYLNRAPGTLAAFEQAGKNALISAGDLWAIRRAARLVGTLEIARVKPNVDLSKSSVRDEFTNSILVGAPSDIRLAGQEVYMVDAQDGVSTLIWFGQGLFEVLQSKDPVVTGPRLAEAIIQYQQTRPEWLPLPSQYAPS